MPQAILFDLDETLTDARNTSATMRHDFAVRCRCWRQRPSTIAEAILMCRCARVTDRVRRDCTISRSDSRKARRLQVSHLRRRGRQAFRGRLSRAKGMQKLCLRCMHKALISALLTNGEVQFQEPKIRQLAIGRYLSTVVISEAVQVQKADPQFFAHALAEIGCRAADTWVARRG